MRTYRISAGSDLKGPKSEPFRAAIGRKIAGKEEGIMLIAHLPAGYIIGSVARSAAPKAPGLMLAALVGSVAPDFDTA